MQRKVFDLKTCIIICLTNYKVEPSIMPITVTWANEQKSAFCWQFQGRWNWVEYAEAMKQSNAMAREVSHPIDVIVDLRTSGMIPSNALSYVKFERAEQPEKMGKIAVVGANSFVTTLVDILRRLNKNFESRIRMVKTMDEALQVTTAPLPLANEQLISHLG
jgi:arabinogalactan endo-1,4-beta-galactosidase